MRMNTVVVAVALALGTVAHAQEPAKPFEPKSGQAGKDVVWVPSPPAMVNKMLEMAKVTPNDFVMDLGSGDGRNIIAAAKLGARALGVEFNPEMVALSRKLAAEAGVADQAQFVEGTMTITQDYQMIKGTVTIDGATYTIPSAALRGVDISFLAGGLNFNGKVNGNQIEGTITTPSGTIPWKATRS